MVLEVLYFLIIIVIALYLFLFLILLTAALFVKVTLEPVRGVCASTLRLDSKIALVTGANQGVGLETARDLASRGAKVIIACRDASRAAAAIADIAATTGNQNIEFKYLDLSKFKSVRKFAEDFNNSYNRLNILVINAGCFDNPKLTEDGIEMVMQVNYFGHFLLTNLLLDKLIASKPSRIVIVSSCLHYISSLRVDDLHRPRFAGAVGQFMNYNNSKLCGIIWMKALIKRLPEEVTVNALHPGVIRTDILKEVPFYIKWMFMFICDVLLFRSPKEGAQTTIHLCVSEEVKHVRGKYFMECKEAAYSSKADDDELVEQVWNKSLQLTSSRWIKHYATTHGSGAEAKDWIKALRRASLNT